MCVVGSTLVAMATKFGLGAEIQSPTSLSTVFLDAKLNYRLFRIVTPEYKTVVLIEKHHYISALVTSINNTLRHY